MTEVLSTSTARVDRVKKMPIYAREGIPHVWLVDPRDRTVEVFQLTESGYALATTWSGEETGEETAPAVLEPFSARPIPPRAFRGEEAKP